MKLSHRHASKSASSATRQPPPHPPFTASDAPRERPKLSARTYPSGSTETAWTVRQLVLLAAWCLIVFCSTTSFIVADVFLDDAPAFPLVPTVVVGTFAAAAAAYTSILLGKCLYPVGSFGTYQPFAGGARFVTIQAFGYFILTTSQVVVLGFVAGLNSAGATTHGLISITGLAALVANIMILGSVFTFNPAEAKSESHAQLGLIVQLLDSVSMSPNRETTLVTIFTIAQLGLSVLGEQHPVVGNVAAIVMGMFHLINGYMTHFVIGYQFTPGYRLFMPFPGTKLQALAQGAIWVVYSVTLYGAGFLWYIGDAAPPIAHVALGSGCLLSAVGLILFARLTKFREEETQDSVSSYGCVVLTISSAMFASVVVLLSALLMLTSVDDHIRFGLEFCQMLASFFILVFPPCTNVMGRLLHGSSFKLFQPFRGGTDFVMLQAAGWTCYGFALLFQTLQLSSSMTNDTPGPYHWIFIEAVLALMAQVLVHSSLRTFRVEAEVDRDTHDPPAESHGLRRILKVVVNGELVTAFLCSACALALRIVVDVADRWDLETCPRTAVLVISVVMYATATPLAHLSGRHYGIPLFRPFDGSGMYVALQSIGWTIYALSLLAILVSWIVSDSFFGGSGLQPRPMFVATSYGVAQFIPLLLVSISVVVESIEVSRTHRAKGFATQAFEAIIRAEQVLLKVDHTSEDERKRELDTLIQELRTASLSLRISSSPARERFPSPSKEGRTHGALAITQEEDSEEQQGMDYAARHFAATIIVVLMSLASLAAYVSGAFWTTVMPLYGVGCATASLAIVTTSCVALHTGYGYQLHGSTGRYTYLMPFVGGTPFVLRQALGWMAYTVCAVLTIAVAIERRSNPVALVLAGIASVVAQFSILESIPCFDANSFQRVRKTFFQSNSAALVATFTFLGSFVFAHLYGRFREETFGHDDGADNDATLRVARAHMVPLVVTGVSMTFAIPLTLMALRSRMSNFERGSETSDGDHHAADHPLKQLGLKRKYLQDLVLAVDSVVLAMSLAIPGAVLYMAYFLLHAVSSSSRSTLSINFGSIAHTWGITMLVIGTLLAFSLAFPLVSSGGVELPSRVRRWREAFVTFQLYMIPTTASLVSYAMPLVFPGSLAAMYFAIAMSFLTVAAHVRVVRTVVLRFSYVLLGYVAYHHCRDFWESPRSLIAFSFDIVTDVVLLVFWVKYESLFRNKPQETGCLRSPWFVSIFERHIIPDVERYFNVKLVLDGTVKDDGNGTPTIINEADMPAAGEPNVERVAPCLTDPKNQYIFSYHPHGVFPGTALILPFTEQWRCHLGSNVLRCVTVHAAGIIFNVPMVRDFLLRLGGRVVTRTALESSLDQGNSVMIVTGGQTEMLHTRYSDKEMHLVTHHHGFLKLAIKHQVPAVPIVCFAENNVMDNIHLPWLQKKMLKMVGFPFPTVPHGRWYLPLPNRTPLTVIVGSPVNPPEGLSADDAKGVQQYADAYFAEVKRLFYAHRVESGYPDMELVLHGGRRH